MPYSPLQMTTDSVDSKKNCVVSKSDNFNLIRF